MISRSSTTRISTSCTSRSARATSRTSAASIARSLASRKTTLFTSASTNSRPACRLSAETITTTTCSAFSTTTKARCPRRPMSPTGSLARSSTCTAGTSWSVNYADPASSWKTCENPTEATHTPNPATSATEAATSPPTSASKPAANHEQVKLQSNQPAESGRRELDFRRCDNICTFERYVSTSHSATKIPCWCVKMHPTSLTTRPENSEIQMLRRPS